MPEDHDRPTSGMARRSHKPTLWSLRSLGAPPKEVFEAARQFKRRFGCTEAFSGGRFVRPRQFASAGFHCALRARAPGAGVPHSAPGARASGLPRSPPSPCRARWAKWASVIGPAG